MCIYNTINWQDILTWNKSPNQLSIHFHIGAKVVITPFVELDDKLKWNNKKCHRIDAYVHLVSYSLINSWTKNIWPTRLTNENLLTRHYNSAQRNQRRWFISTCLPPPWKIQREIQMIVVKELSTNLYPIQQTTLSNHKYNRTIFATRM